MSGIDLPSHVSAPRLFIVNCQLPSEAPALLNAADDGPGYNVVFYFGMTQVGQAGRQAGKQAGTAEQLGRVGLWLVLTTAVVMVGWRRRRPRP